MLAGPTGIYLFYFASISFYFLVVVVVVVATFRRHLKTFLFAEMFNTT